jgi:hypothetical protein
MLFPAQLARMKLGAVHVDGTAIQQRSPEIYPYGSYSRVSKTPRVMGHNDVNPDCVSTAYCNAIVTAMWRHGLGGTINDDVPLSIYKIFDPTLTTGMNPEDMWAWGMKNPVQGWQLKSWARINHNDEKAVRATVEARGFVPLTIALSVAQQNQRLWMPEPGPNGTPGGWGYHCAGIDGFSGPDSTGTSWGEEIGVGRAYFYSPGYVLAAYDLELQPV